MRPRVAVVDVLGTVLDEVAGFRAAVASIGLQQVDADALAARWIAQISDVVAGVAVGQLAWRPWEQVIADTLTVVLPQAEHGSPDGNSAELLRVGRRLPPWPDSRAGLDSLRARCDVVALSNAGIGPLLDCFRAGELAWNAVLSAEMVRSAKPDPRVYTFALDVLGVVPREVGMVAAHPWDLRAAGRHGMRTAYIRRPGSAGPDSGDEFDEVADDLVQLAGVISAT